MGFKERPLTLLTFPLPRLYRPSIIVSVPTSGLISLTGRKSIRLAPSFLDTWKDTMNPYSVPLPAVVGTSGGRTSGYLAWHVWQATRQSRDVRYLFQNTGFEHPATIRFLTQMRDIWGLPIQALEYDHPCNGSGPESGMIVREVRLEDCSLDGRPFRTLLKAIYAYRTQSTDRKCPSCNGSGIIDGALLLAQCGDCMGTGERSNYSPLPSPAQRLCTAYTKEKTSRRYLLSTYDDKDFTFIPGLRADEMRRVVKARARGDVCPLASAGVTKPMILEWWRSQPFDLEIPDLLGNCGGCFLKSTGKILWIAHYYPETLEPMAELEEQYGDTFRRDRPSYRRLLAMGREMSDARADSLIAPSTQEALPMGFSCSLDDELPCNCTD